MRARIFILLGVIVSGLTACGGGGSSGLAVDTTPSVFARFAYVANSDDASIGVYAIDSDTGRLHMQSKVATGSFPFSVAVTRLRANTLMLPMKVMIRSHSIQLRVMGI